MDRVEERRGEEIGLVSWSGLHCETYIYRVYLTYVDLDLCLCLCIWICTQVMTHFIHSSSRKGRKKERKGKEKMGDEWTHFHSLHAYIPNAHATLCCATLYYATNNQS